MTKDDLRQILSEAVDMKLREILPQVLDEYFSGIKSQRVQSPPATRNNLTQNRIGELREPTVKKNYTKNRILNDILNETVVKIRPDITGQEGHMGQSVLDRVNDAPPSVVAALTRDYSQLLKLSREKSSNK